MFNYLNYLRKPGIVGIVQVRLIAMLEIIFTPDGRALCCHAEKTGYSWPNVESARQMRQHVFEFIEIYWISGHLANGWVTTVEFEKLYNQN